MTLTAGLLWRLGYRVGYPDWITVASPAAGTNASYTVSGTAAVRVLAARASLTTDATVANRFFSLDFINARGVTYLRNAAGLVVTASTTAQKFEWSVGRTVAEWAANTPILVGVVDTFLYPGSSVQFTVDSIQATDQISGLQLYVECFETGEMGYELGAVRNGQVPSFAPGE